MPTLGCLLKYIQPTVLKSIFISLALLLLAAHCDAQKEYNHWMLASKTRLDFSGGAPVIYTYNYPQIPGAAESGASISDTSGRLQFYTFEGRDIYNRNHAVMANGTGIRAHVSVQQGELIIPSPRKNNTYFLITHQYPYYGVYGHADTIYYSVVDMNANGGLGAVTKKNVVLNPRRAYDEKCTATWHYDRKRIWLLTHDWDTDEFYAYMVDSNGIDTTPVISRAGSPSLSQQAGEMHVSDNGCYLTQTMRGGWGGQAFVEVLHFDNKTGKVGGTVFYDSSYAAWGSEFSDDNSRLYLTHNGYYGIYQYNMLAGSPAAIAASRTLITPTTIASYRLCRGPDNKIYVVIFNAGPGAKVTQLAVINQPRLLGAACNYNQNAFPGLTSNSQDLPNNWNLIYRGPNCDGKYPPVDSSKHNDTVVIVNPGTTGGHATTTNIQVGPGHVDHPEDTTHLPPDTTGNSSHAFGVPSAFSPDGNGMNDVLYVKGNGIEQMRFRILNRWGQVVFESTSPKIGWDGTYKGKPQDSDVYVYLLWVQFKDGSTAEQQGNITLMR